MKKSEFFKITKSDISKIVIIKKEEALEAVKQDGYALQYVKEQTAELCLEAVKQDGYALQYVDITVFEED